MDALKSRIVAPDLASILRGMRDDHGEWGGMREDDRPHLAKNRIHHGYATLQVKPKFTLTRDCRVFVIGSCFARNIERYLAELGVPLADRYRQQKNHVAADRLNDAAMFNRFTVASIETEAHAITDPEWLGERLIYDGGSDRVWDGYFSPGQLLASRGEKLRLRREILRYQHDFVRTAGAVFITLGLTEGVRDVEAGLFVNGLPNLGRHWNDANGNRFVGMVTGVEDALDSLERMRASLRALAGPDLKIVVTVSPVPLANTFTGLDIVTANSASKATLRVAAGAFADAHADVDYFPSYEMVLHSRADMAWKADRRHVDNDMVEKVVITFLTAYFVERTATTGASQD